MKGFYGLISRIFGNIYYGFGMSKKQLTNENVQGYEVNLEMFCRQRNNI